MLATVKKLKLNVKPMKKKVVRVGLKKVAKRQTKCKDLLEKGGSLQAVKPDQKGSKKNQI